MSRIIRINSVRMLGIFVALGTCSVAAAQQGNVQADQAQGFGAIAKGGEGGKVIAVTTLNDKGPGSLREALAATGPRIIRFSVEGTIELNNRLRVTEGRVTIDGSTAPGNGITLLHHGIHFCGDCDDIIVRHLRIRVTTGGSSGDCLLFWGDQGGMVERVLVDHCSPRGEEFIVLASISVAGTDDPVQASSDQPSATDNIVATRINHGTVCSLVQNKGVVPWGPPRLAGRRKAIVPNRPYFDLLCERCVCCVHVPGLSSVFF